MNPSHPAKSNRVDANCFTVAATVMSQTLAPWQSQPDDNPNLWPNCLVGDGKLPAEQSRTRTNIPRYSRPPKTGEHPICRTEDGPVDVDGLPCAQGALPYGHVFFTF